MRVLFVSLKWEYGRKEWGLSFEYQNLYDSMRRMLGVEVRHFPVDEKLKELGRDRLNQDLLEEVIEWRPDLMFTFLFTEELKWEVVKQITDKTNTVTFNWFADDHWRFPIYSQRWAKAFSAVGTTDFKALAKYQKVGVPVVLTQWAANPALFFPQRESGILGSAVSFVGNAYGKRAIIGKTLREQGVDFKGYGNGWEGGRVSHEQMLSIFSGSLINLNFVESSGLSWQELPKVLGKLLFKNEFGHVRFDGLNIGHNLQSLWGRRRKQIKARIFEIMACGGFLLSGNVDTLDAYFELRKEMDVFDSTKELVEKIQYYLDHDEERKMIALAGFKRVLHDHTYEKRFMNIFEFLGLNKNSP